MIPSREGSREGGRVETWTYICIIQRVRQQNRPAGTNRLVGLILCDGDRAVEVILDGNHGKWGDENFGVGVIDPVVAS
jgi:hypothetical protein